MRTGRLLLASGTGLVLATLGASGSIWGAGALVPGGSATRSPYDGTPAENFVVGAAGIVPPPAEPVPDGYLTDDAPTTRDIAAVEVAEALADVRAALVATRLDHRMLVDHEPDSFLRNLARSYWDTWFDPYVPFVGLDFEEQPDAAEVATRLAPGARLAAEPRVAGRMTYGPATTDRGVPATETRPWWTLEIVTRFVWVYAFGVTEDESATGIVVVRSEVVWYVPTDYRLDCCQPNRGLHYAEAEARAWGADCELYEELGLIRPDPSGYTTAVTEAVFDVDQPPEPATGCRQST